MERAHRADSAHRIHAYAGPGRAGVTGELLLLDWLLCQQFALCINDQQLCNIAAACLAGVSCWSVWIAHFAAAVWLP